MAVLIKSGNRMCNATCYNAKTPSKSCGCICNGVNHGVGKAEAIKRMKAYARAQKIEAESILINCWKAEMQTKSEQEEIF